MRAFLSGKYWRKVRRGFRKKFPNQVRGVVAYLGIVMVLSGSFVWYTNNRIQEKAEASGNATEIQFLQNSLQAAESQSSPVIPVVLNGTASEDVSFDYSIIGGTAAGGEDYTLATSGTFTIPKGERGIGIPLVLIDDKMPDDNETIQIQISNPSGGVSLGGNTILEFTITDSKNLYSDPYFGLKQEIDTLPDIQNPIPSSLPDFATTSPTTLPDFSVSDPTSLSVTNGLIVHLDADTITDADGSDIQTWSDLSGNGNDVEQTDTSKQPNVLHNSLNGKKTVNFNGSSDALYSLGAVTTSDDVTIVTVTTPSTKGHVAGLSAQNDNSIFSANIKNSSQGRYSFSRNSSSGNGVFDRVQDPSINSIDISLHGPQTVDLEFYSNGYLSTDRQSSINETFTQADRFANVGASRVGDFFDGGVAEVIMYDRRISNEEREEIQCYLSQKYGINVSGCGDPLELHLDASLLTDSVGSALSAWPDTSGNAFDAGQTNTANQPELVNDFNNKQAVRFGANDYMNINGLTLDSRSTIFTVSKQTGTSTDANILSSNNGTFKHRYISGNTLNNTFYNGSGSVYAGAISGPYNGYLISGSKWNGIDRTVFTPNDIDDFQTNAIYAGLNYENFVLGADVNGTNYHLNGDIAEVIVYNKDLNEEEIDAVECYLSGKYDIFNSGCADPLKLHLDADTLTEADGETVATWFDQTSSGLNATQGDTTKQPTVVHNAINGKKTLRFDGGDYLELPEFYTDSNSTLITVAKRNNNSSTNTIFHDYGNNNNERIQFYIDSSNRFRTLPYDESGQSVSAITTSSTDDYFIGSMILEGNNIVVNNNNEQVSNTNTIFRNFVNYEGGLSNPLIGALSNSNGNPPSSGFLNGDIAEFIYYDRPLSENEYNEVRCYLADKYAINVHSCGAALMLNLDANDLTAANNSPISSWLDNSGNNLDGVQGDASRQPLLMENNLNGNNVVRFDGVDDYLELPEFFEHEDITLYVVGTKQDDKGTLFNDGDNSTEFATLRIFNDKLNVLTEAGTNSQAANSDLSLSNGENFIAKLDYSIYGSSLGLNTNTAEVNGSSTGSGADVLPTIGGISGQTSAEIFYEGDIAQVLVFDGSLSNKEQHEVECYLSRRYNIENNGCLQDTVIARLENSAFDGISQGSNILEWQDSSQNNNDFVLNYTQYPTLQSYNGVPYADFDTIRGAFEFDSPISAIENNSYSILTTLINTQRLNSDHIMSVDGVSLSGLATSTGYNTLFNNSFTGNIETGRAVNTSDTLAYSVNGLTTSIVIDGDNKSTLSAAPNIGNGVLFVGNNTQGSSAGFEEGIGAFTVFNKSLSDAQMEIVSTIQGAAYGSDLERYKYSEYPEVLGVNSMEPLTNSDGIVNLELTNYSENAKGYIGYSKGESIGISSSNLPGGVVSRWNNQFAFDKSEKTDVTISFDFDKYLGGIPSGSDYELLYRQENGVGFSVVPLQSSAIDGSVIEFEIANADVQDGFYTVGTKNTNVSPLSPAQVPDAINDLSVSLGGNYGEIDLNFTAPTDNGSTITDYLIEYSVDGFNTILVYNDGVSTSTDYILTDLLNGPEYQFRVRAITSSDSQSDLSNHESITFAPRITSISPDYGVPEGGQIVVISGDNLLKKEAVPLVVDNSAGVDLPNYTGHHLFDSTQMILENGVLPDCSNLVVEYNNAVIPTWIDPETCNTTQTSLYFAYPIPAGEIVEFGLLKTLDDQNLQNPEEVFELFDDFEGSDLDMTKWNITNPNGYLTQQNGVLQINKSANGWQNPKMYSADTFDRSELEFHFKYLNNCEQNSNNIMIGWQTISGAGYQQMPYTDYFRSTSNHSHFETGTSRTGASWTCGQQYYLRTRLKPDEGAIYYRSTDGINWIETRETAHSSATNLRVGFDGFRGNIYLDNFWVKTYTDTEPVVSLGSGTDALNVTLELDGVQASFVEVDSNGDLVYTVSPANTAGNGLGQVDVAIINSDLQSDTLVNGYTFEGPTISGINPAQGSQLGGYTATLVGDNFPLDFTGGTIDFAGGGTGTDITVVDNQTLTFTVPAGSSLGQSVITLTTPYGNQATVNFEYISPQLNSIDESSGAVEGGYQVSLNGGGFVQNNNYNKITLDNSSNPDTLVDYVARVEVDTRGATTNNTFSDDCRELVVVDTDQSTVLPYWVDASTCNTQNTVVWFKINQLDAGIVKEVFLEVSDNRSSSLADGDSVFLLFDDFEDDILDISKWLDTTPTNNLVLENGYLKQVKNFTGSGYMGIQSVQDFPVDVIVEAKKEFGPDFSSSYDIAFGFLEGLADANSAKYKASTTGWLGYSRDASSNTQNSSTGNTLTTEGFFDRMEVARLTGSNEFSSTINNTTYDGSTTVLPVPANLKVFDGFEFSSNWIPNVEMKTHSIHVRNYFENEPVVSIESNFSSNVDITFGGVSATSLEFVSSSEYKVVVPLSSLTGTNGIGDGYVDVVYTGPDGQSVTLANGFEYKLPEIYSITPTEGPDQGGNDVVIKGDYFSELAYRKNISIDNTSGSPIPDYEHRIVLDTASLIAEDKLGADCAQLRITDENGADLNYYLEGECDSKYTVVWFEVPNLPTGVTDLQLTYHSGTAVSQSDILNFSFGALLNDTQIAYGFQANKGVEFDPTTNQIINWHNNFTNTSASQADNVNQPIFEEGLSFQDLPTVYFDGTDDELDIDLSSILSSDFTMVSSTNRSSDTSRYFIGGDNGNSGRSFIAGYQTNTNLYHQYVGSVTLSSTIPGFVQRENAIISTTQNLSNGKELYYNGTLVDTNTSTYTPISLNTMRLGTHNTTEFEGGINEVLLFNSTLIPSDLAIVEDYLLKKYSQNEVVVGAEELITITIDGISIEDPLFVDSQTIIGKAPANAGINKNIQYSSIVGNTAELTAGYDYGVDLPPNAIIDLALTQASSGVIELSWSEPNNNGQQITDYVIEYDTDSDFNNSQVYTDGVGFNLSYTIADLNPLETYYFRVYAVNSVGNAEVSNSVVRTGAVCDNDFGGQDWTISVDTALSGVYCNIDDLVIEPGVVATLEEETKVEIYANNISVYGQINGVGSGYQARNDSSNCDEFNGFGPGGGQSNSTNTSGGGGAHGGVGGHGSKVGTFLGGEAMYGSIEFPDEFGSGGAAGRGNCGSPGTGGFGGGAIKIVTDTLDVTGSIDVTGADGEGGSTGYGNGYGAGGSIWIDVNTINGDGEIIANGGSGAESSVAAGGAGGGGRIAIHSSINNFSGAVSARGGEQVNQPERNGGAGTVYYNNKTTGDETLSIIGGSYSRTGTLVDDTLTNITDIKPDFQDANINLQKELSIIVPTLNVPQDYTYTIGDQASFDSIVDWNIGGVLEFSGMAQHTAGDIIILDQGVLTHVGNNDIEDHRLDIVANNLTVETGGKIDLSGRGYDGATGFGNGPGYGPGGGQTTVGTVCNSAGGGGHGGAGGNGGTNPTGSGGTYGSKDSPITIGSGGARACYTSGSHFGGDGGGAIKISLSGDANINGAIDVRGTSGGGTNNGFGSGSGGSIWVETGNLLGNGDIIADGGSETASFAAGGGGGRIALYYEDKAAELNVTADRGNGGSSGTIDDGQDGTIYENQIPENSLSSAVFGSDPLPVQENVAFDLQIENILNIFGNPIRNGYYDDVSCEITVTGDGGNYNETVTGGTVEDGVCILPAQFVAPTATGNYNAAVTVVGSDVNSTTETTNLPFTVAVQGTNLAKAQVAPNETKPQYATLSPEAVQLIGNSTTITAAGFVDSGNDLELNGIPCDFRVTGPSSFDQTFTSGNLVGGECQYDFTEFELPAFAGTYTVEVQVQGGSGNLITDPVTFERAFDVHLTAGGLLVGSNTTDNDPTIGDQINTITSPIIYKHDGVTVMDEGVVCTVQVTDNAGSESFASTVNSSGQCEVEVPANTLTGSSIDVVSQVDLDIDGSTYSFITATDTIALVGSPSDLAKEDFTNAGQPVYNTQTINPDPAFLNEDVTLTVDGLLDSITDGNLENAACEFVVTNPNNVTFTFNSTIASNGECEVVIPGGDLLEGGNEVEGQYSFVLNIAGDSGILSTPSVVFDRFYNIDLTGGFVPGATTSNPDPIVVGQAPTLTSPRMFGYNGTTALQNGLACENELTVSGQSPEIVTGTTSNGYCVTAMGTQPLVGSANMVSRVTVAGQVFETGSTPIEIKALNNASICGLVFRDDTSDQSYDGTEVLFAGLSIRLKDNTGAEIETKTSLDTGYQCFSSLFDGTYTLEILNSGPGGTQTLPIGGNNFFTITLGAGATENRAFGFNGNENICPNPVFNDYDENGIQNGSEPSLVDGSTTLPITLYAVGDLSNAIETIQADGNLCFQPQIPGDYVIEMDIPAGMSPTGTGNTVVGNKVQRSVTLEFGVEVSTGFGFSFDPTGEAEEDPNNQGQPTNTGTVVFDNELIYEGYDFGAVTSGFVDTGNDLPLDGVTCSMTFSGPGINPDATINGNVVSGECEVSGAIALDAGPHAVITTVQGANGPLTTLAATFDVLPNEIDICPLPFRDYNLDGVKNDDEPYIAGLNVDLVDNNTLNTIASITTDSLGLNCFQEVDGGDAADYQLNITAPSNSVETTTTGLTINIDPVPNQDEDVEFGFKGVVSLCADSVYMDNNADSIRNSSEAGLTGYTWRVTDDFGNLVGTTSTDANGEGCIDELLEADYSVQVTAPVSQIDLTGVQADIRTITATPGSGNGADTNTYAEAYGYENTAEICPFRTFADYNQDGVWQSGEDEIGNLATRLYLGTDNSGTLLQTILTNGSNCFAVVDTGDTSGDFDYFIEQDAPAGGTLTTTGVAYTFTQTFGDPINVDFGYQGNTSVCPFPAYQDLNTNGAFDTEPYIDGIVTTLRDTTNDIIGTLTTNNSGPDCFDDLLEGSYSISQEPPSNTISTTGGTIINVTTTSGATENVQFGYDGRPLICPVVYRDDDGNSLFDTNEFRFGLVTVTLKDDGGNLLETIQSTTGEKCFDTQYTEVGESYIVESEAYPNYTITTSIALGSPNDNPDTTANLVFGQKYEPEFGYNGNGQICATNVFEDFNANGQYDAGVDTHLPDGTMIELTTLQGSTDYPAISIMNGSNCFVNVAPGQYTLDVAGNDKPVGSLSTTGGVQQISLSPGQTQNFDFGYTGDVTICPQTTYEDLDFNAVFNPTTESQLSGIMVNLYRGSELSVPYQTLTLSGSGTECFTGLFADDYRIEQQDIDSAFPGLYWNTNEVSQSTADPDDFYVDITTVSQDYILQDFAYTQNPDFTLGAIFGFLYVDRDENDSYDIAGADNFELTVFDNDVPVVDQTVKLFKLNTSTSLYEEIEATVSDSEGNYSFNRLGVGDYEVRVPNSSLVGIKSITPNPSVIPVVITNDTTTGLNDKAYEQDMSFQFTARICPFMYVDVNEDGNYDDGIDYDITANEGATYSLSYSSFNGNQFAGSYSIGSGSLCIEELPPRDYTLTLSDPFASAGSGAFGPNGEYPITFFDQADDTSWTRTIYLATEINDIETRVFSSQSVDQTESEIEGTVWHNRPIYGSGDPFGGSLDTDGGDDKTEALDDAGNTSGYDYDYDNDYGYDGVTLELIKCNNGFQDLVPKGIWNANPPTVTTDSNGYYKFDESNVQFNDGSGGYYGIVPGEYAVIRQGSLPDESTLAGVRAKECVHIGPDYLINSIFFDNYPSAAPGKPVDRTSLQLGITHVHDEVLLVVGRVHNNPYIDQNQDLQQSGTENSCYLQGCTAVPDPSQNVYGSFRLRDAATNDILGVVPYNIKSFSISNIGYPGTSFGGIPGVIPGDYIVEMIDVDPIDPNTSLPYYNEIQAGELSKNHTQVLDGTVEQYYGFKPLFGTSISGQVFINRDSAGDGADIDGSDNNLVTDFDNDEVLAGYTVEIRNSSGELVATLTTDADGLYDWSPGGQGIPEGAYTMEVINAPPTGTDCGSCSSSAYISVLGGTSLVEDRFLTYRYIGYIGADAFVDNNGDGIIESNQNTTELGREIAIRNTTDITGTVWDYQVSLTYEKGTPQEYVIEDDYFTPTCGMPSISVCQSDLAVLTNSFHINTSLKPGTYTVDLTINDSSLTLTPNSTGQLTNTINLAPQGKNWTRWAFNPRTDNNIIGNVFIDRGTLNETFEINGEDGVLGNGSDPASFDNEQALVGAIVKINGPNGQIISADAPTDANGNYTFSGIETGLYKLFQDDPNSAGYKPFVETTDSIINTIKPKCMTLYGCFDEQGSSFRFNLSRKQVFTTGTNVTNNYTYIFTNKLAAYSVLDLNGDGVISSYSNGSVDEIIGNQDYELVNNNTGLVLSCDANNFGELTPLSSASLSDTEVCYWQALPAEINGNPASYTIRKLVNIVDQNLITTRRINGVHGPGSDGLSLGAVNEATHAFNQFGLNQQQAFAFYQSSDVVTNNASITGFAFIDINGDGIYQPDGLDGDPNTIEDNETPLLTTDFILSGDADRTASAGSLGQYQFTDLAAGNYVVASNLDVGVGSYTMRITNTTLVNDAVNGDFYRVTFSTQGFTPSNGGRHIRFYWDTEDSSAGGLEYFDNNQYEIPIASRPAGADQICVVVMENTTTPIENSGDCQPLP